MKEIIAEILKNNGWLNGWYDYKSGDVMAIVNQPEKFESLGEPKDLEELYSMLRNYDGTFKYDKLLFFNDSQYGCFVYYIDKPESYIEHLSIHIMSFENLKTIVKNS